MTESEYFTTKEVASLLRIKERKVYDLAAEQLIPCTRATGKLLFSRAAVNHWLDSHSSGASFPDTPELFCGSHDPLLEWAIRESQCGIPTLFDGSVDGLDRVLTGQASVSALHIYTPADGQWNTSAVKARVISEAAGKGSVVLLGWVIRQRGILTRKNIKIDGIKDFARHSVVTRQSGAGSQLLLEHLLSEESLSIEDVNQSLTARSEADLALAIAEEKADCGLGLASLARQHSLEFLPVVDEYLDLLVERRFWFEPSMQMFIRFCESSAFASHMDSLAGYRCEQMFEVGFNS